MAFKISFLLICLAWNFLEVSLKEPNICDGNVCPAEQGTKNGKCICCTDCVASFNRQKGTLSCPLSRADCGKCIPGAKEVKTFNGGTVDVCNIVPPDVKEPTTDDDLSPIVEENKTEIGLIVGVVLVLIFLAAAGGWIIYRKKFKQSDIDDVESTVTEDTSSQDGCDVPKKVPVEDTEDVTAVHHNLDGVAQIEENQRQCAQPTDDGRYNPNQTFYTGELPPRVPDIPPRDPEIPPRVPEIPTAPSSFMTTDGGDFCPSFSTTYSSASTARADDAFSSANTTAPNTQERPTVSMNLNLALEVMVNH